MKPAAFPASWLPRPVRFVLLASLAWAGPIPGTGITSAPAQTNMPLNEAPPAAPSMAPLWMKGQERVPNTGPDISAPLWWDFLDWTATGDLLFTEMEIAGVNAYLMVSPATGKVLQRLDLPKRPKRRPSDPFILNHLSTYQILPDGRFILAFVRYQQDAQVKSKASVEIIVLDPRQKLKTTSAPVLTFDDPAASRPSGVVQFENAICVHTLVLGSRLVVANPYFLAEFDLASWKLLHRTKTPAVAETILGIKTGVLWETAAKDSFAADFGGQVRAVGKDEATKLKATYDPGWRRDPGADGLATLTADGKIQIAFPNQPAQTLNLLLTPPPTWVQAYQNGPSCLLEIGRTDGSTLLCGIKPPAAATTAPPSAAVSPQPANLPTWTNPAGIAIAGEFIRLESDTLIIRKDGQEFKIPLTKLSPASQDQARKLAGPPPTSP